MFFFRVFQVFQVFTVSHIHDIQLFYLKHLKPIPALSAPFYRQSLGFRCSSIRHLFISFSRVVLLIFRQCIHQLMEFIFESDVFIFFSSALEKLSPVSDRLNCLRSHLIVYISSSRPISLRFSDLALRIRSTVNFPSFHFDRSPANETSRPNAQPDLH